MVIPALHCRLVSHVINQQDNAIAILLLHSVPESQYLVDSLKDELAYWEENLSALTHTHDLLGQPGKRITNLITEALGKGLELKAILRSLGEETPFESQIPQEHRLLAPPASRIFFVGEE